MCKDKCHIQNDGVDIQTTTIDSLSCLLRRQIRSYSLRQVKRFGDYNQSNRTTDGQKSVKIVHDPRLKVKRPSKFKALL